MADVPLMNNPMTTAGDVIQGGASGAPARLALGTAGQILKVNAGATALEYGAAAAAGDLDAALYERVAGDYTITSTTFVDVDATNLALTITTGARRCLVGLVGTASHTLAGTGIFLDVDVDGTRLGGADGIMRFMVPQAGYWVNPSFTALTDVLTAASHTFKLQARTGSGTLTLQGSANRGLQFFVTELYAG